MKLTNGKLEVEINEDVLEITSAKLNGKEFLYQKDNEWKKDFPVLFPICGMVVDDEFSYNGKKYEIKRHGFFREIKKWKIISESETKVTFEYTSNGEFLKVYPWDFKIQYIVEIKDNELKLINIVQNESNESMYYNLGYHPAFIVDKQNGTIKFDKPQNMYKDSHDLKYLVKNPTNFVHIDDVRLKHIDFKNSQFYWTTNLQATKFNYDDNERSLEINLDNYQRKTFLMWSESNEADFVCFEPMDGHADYWPRKTDDITKKDDILELKPNEIKEHSFAVKLFTK